MDNKKNHTLSIYGSHDSSITFIDKNKTLRIYEYERFVKKRYAMFSSEYDGFPKMGSNNEERAAFLKLVKNNLIDEDIRVIHYLHLNEQDKSFIKEFFKNADFEEAGHHFSHACSGYYSSNFNQAWIFSIDGGGWDEGQTSMSKIYKGEGGIIKEIPSKNKDFGNPYSAIGYLISEIKTNGEEKGLHDLSHAGKIMGLCAYGGVRGDWLEKFEKYYDNGGDIAQLCREIGINFIRDAASGQISYDLAATSQYVFEMKMDELIMPIITDNVHNVVLVGGCALNVLYNQKLYEFLKKQGRSLYIPPNPNDCGESYGMFLNIFPELGTHEIVYNGIEILDEGDIEFYCKDRVNEISDFSKIVSLLKAGKILGVVDGNSEVGPRSLGNRSIICDPSFPSMKDTLNSKVKFREWYRPFAPVCRLEDKDVFFDDAQESKYMSFAPKVKEKYKNELSSIVHGDGTARLQTVSEKQHSFFYNILSKLSEENYTPVILNTSFNIRGFPILTTLKDAFFVLDNTELDALVIKDRIFFKK